MTPKDAIDSHTMKLISNYWQETGPNERRYLIDPITAARPHTAITYYDIIRWPLCKILSFDLYMRLKIHLKIRESMGKAA